MGKFANTRYEGKRESSYLLQDSLKVLYFYRIDFLFVSLLLILSVLFFRDILENDMLLLFGQVAHGDLQYALTVDEHIFHHLSNLPIHAAKIPLLLTLYPLQIIFGDPLAEKVFTTLILFLAATLVYLANKQFVSRFEGNIRGYWLSASCFVGSLIIMYNPWTINEIHHHYWLVLSLAASYLLIATIDSYLRSKEQNNVRRFLLMAFSTSLVATQPQGVIVFFLPMLAIYFIVNLVFHRPKIVSKYAAKKLGIILITIIACNIFWLLPVLQTLLAADSMSQGTSFLNYETSQGFATYGIVQENVDQLSRRATLHNVLEGTGAWRWGGDSTPDQSIKINNIDLWEVLAFVPLCFIFAFFIIPRPIGKSIYIAVFFIALVIVSIILATGSYYNDIYKRFFLDLPFGESIRDPYKFSGLYFVTLSFFASAFLFRIESKTLRKNIAIILLAAGLIFSWGWVGLTGNLNGHMTIPPYPRDLADVSQYLHTEYGINGSKNDVKGKIFWYPSGGERTQLQYSSVPELSTESLPHLKLSPYELNYINDLIKKNDTSFITLLEDLGVQYLVIREDLLGNTDDNDDDSANSEPRREILMRLQNIKTLLHENIAFESDRFGVYKLNTNSPVAISHTISSGTDDLFKVVKAAKESEYLNNNIELGPFLDNDSVIVSDRLPPEPSRGSITIIDPTSEHYFPSTYWSTGAINGGWLNTITPSLDKFGIKTWQSDYNKGFIYTWGGKYIPSNHNLKNTKTLTTFDFNSLADLSQWQNNDPKDQLLNLQNNAMIAVLNSSNIGWKTITSPAFDVSTVDDEGYVIDLRMRYLNAEGLHLKVAEYDKNGVLISNNIVQGIGTGTSDWKDIAFSYIPSSNEVKSIKLSIWHGHLTKQPLPNVLWIDSVKIYDVSDQMVENSIDVPFKVVDDNNNNNNNEYKLFIRYLESPQGGLIDTALEGDSSRIQINTLSPHSKVVWKDLGNYTLNPGSHTMTFTNEKGFNAINVMLLIQKDQFEAIKGQIQGWLNQNSTTILQIFDPEFDLKSNNTSIGNSIPSTIDNTALVNGTAWTQFHINKDDDYRVWIKGSGLFSVIIDGHKEIVNASMNRPATFSDPFKLKEGDYRLEVTPLPELEKLKLSDQQDDAHVIDSIWLVSDSSLLHQLFDENENDSLNQTQVATTTISNNMWSSQKYEIKLNNISTTRPLMISLAEPFNPDLKAAIYTKEGRLAKVENIIPLFYSLKSGIYIDSPVPDEKVVIYNAKMPIGWLFVIASLVSLASYVLIMISTNVKLTNGFKGLIYKMNHLMKLRIAHNRNDKNNSGYNS